MKVHAYARDMNLNRNCVKNNIETQYFFLENKTMIYFLIQLFYSPVGYLAVITMI